MSEIKVFQLNRHQDPTDVSGTGIVACGVQFPNGKVTLSWNTQYHSIGVYDSMEQMEAIHCHHGATTVEWLVDSVNPTQLSPGWWYIPERDEILKITEEPDYTGPLSYSEHPFLDGLLSLFAWWKR